MSTTTLRRKRRRPPPVSGPPDAMRPAVIDSAIRHGGVVEAIGRLPVGGVFLSRSCAAACGDCPLACTRAGDGSALDLELMPKLLRSLRAAGRVVFVGGLDGLQTWERVRAALAAAPPHLVVIDADSPLGPSLGKPQFRDLHELGVAGVVLTATPGRLRPSEANALECLHRDAVAVFGLRNVLAPRPDAARIPAYAAGGGGADRSPSLCPTCPAIIGGPVGGEWWQTMSAPGRGPGGCAVGCDRVRTATLVVGPDLGLTTACGLVLGSAANGGLKKLWRGDPLRHNAVAQVLREKGPIGLARQAHAAHGLPLPARTGQPCLLCRELRKKIGVPAQNLPA